MSDLNEVENELGAEVEIEMDIDEDLIDQDFDMGSGGEESI